MSELNETIENTDGKPPIKGKRNGDRRRFLKKTIMGGCGLAIGATAVNEILNNGEINGDLRIGFAGDVPEVLGSGSKVGEYWESSGKHIVCRLCPHECILKEGDRGYCRVRVVKNNKLHTLVYGNPCSVHIDPVEKKPLYHFLPGKPILSIATAGCNLRCLNCQNWEISQARPEETRNSDLPPEKLVEFLKQRKIPAIAYTYSEPIIFFEYVKATSEAARANGIRNVLVTAGFISESPLRDLCRFTDAANVDLKSFSNRFYEHVTGGRLKPVLRALEIMKEEGVWVEVTRLIVPEYSDDLDDIRKQCRWMARSLGTDTPLHFSRFHPAHKLTRLPPTSTEMLNRARLIAREEGLQYVYIGNTPETSASHTPCSRCGRRVVERKGYQLRQNLLINGQCPCGEVIPGRWM